MEQNIKCMDCAYYDKATEFCNQYKAKQSPDAHFKVCYHADHIDKVPIVENSDNFIGVEEEKARKELWERIEGQGSITFTDEAENCTPTAKAKTKRGKARKKRTVRKG